MMVEVNVYLYTVTLKDCWTFWYHLCNEISAENEIENNNFTPHTCTQLDKNYKIFPTKNCH